MPSSNRNSASDSRLLLLVCRSRCSTDRNRACKGRANSKDCTDRKGRNKVADTDRNKAEGNKVAGTLRNTISFCRDRTDRGIRCKSYTAHTGRNKVCKGRNKVCTDRNKACTDRNRACTDRSKVCTGRNRVYTMVVDNTAYKEEDNTVYKEVGSTVYKEVDNTVYKVEDNKVEDSTVGKVVDNVC